MRKIEYISYIYHTIYFKVPKDVILNSTHYLIMKIRNKRELLNIAFDHSADIGYKDLLKAYRNYTKEPYTFMTIDAVLPPDNPMKFRKNVSDSPS